MSDYGVELPSERMDTEPTDAFPSQGLLERPEPSNLARSDTGHLLNASWSTADALQMLNAAHRPHKIWRKRYAKLLVVGDAGLGKTTLIRTLLSVPGQTIQLHDGAETSIEQFRRNPKSMCSQITWANEEDRVEWSYTIQDTPGYGDKVNMRHNIEAMVHFVRLQNQIWYRLENSLYRPADMSTIEDPRIDVCLFCLPPHRLRYIDVRFMYELSKVVPIIPIITKADTMNIREATIFRQEVHSKLQNLSQFGIRGHIDLFEFQRETLERAGVDSTASQFQTMPFLIVASNEVNAKLGSEGTFWPERQYAWGTCEAFNPHHSDILHLRMLLLKEGLEEISCAKLQRYELWRRHRMSRVRVGFNLKAMILTTTAFLAFGLGKSIVKGRPMTTILTEMVGIAIDRFRRLTRWRPFSKRSTRNKRTIDPMFG